MQTDPGLAGQHRATCAVLRLTYAALIAAGFTLPAIGGVRTRLRDGDTLRVRVMDCGEYAGAFLLIPYNGTGWEVIADWTWRERTASGRAFNATMEAAEERTMAAEEAAA